MHYQHYGKQLTVKITKWHNSYNTDPSAKIFLGILLLRAHIQYICYIPAKYQISTLKALGGADFTKSTPLPIIQYVQWSKIG